MAPCTWWSYDEIAEGYDRIAVPHYFERPARQLISLLELRRTERVLDVGAGTGMVAVAARNVVGGDRVAPTDPSLQMLLRARLRQLGRAVVSGLPHLPFADRSFDCVTAGFVLNHSLDPDDDLREMARVLCPTGRLGVTSWAVGPADNEIGMAWSAIAGSFVAPELLAAEAGRALPGEQRLASLEALEETLRDAGLSIVLSRQIEFPISITTGDYLESRSAGMTARFMRSVLPASVWQRFEDTVADVLPRTLGARLNLVTRVNFVIAARTGAGRAAFD